MLENNDVIVSASQKESPHFDERPPATDISLLVVHNISLPPGEFGGDDVEHLFMGTLDESTHPFYEGIAGLRVSAHCVIRRDGSIEQYVPLTKRAWHAGLSVFQGQQKCNDYSIGIELEGTDVVPYTQAQYHSLISLSSAIMDSYPRISLGRIVGHNDIAPGRKTDPGPSFDWAFFRRHLMLFRQENKV